MIDVRLDLITGKASIPTRQEIQHEEYMTAVITQTLGKCDYACEYVEPYGWVPEADCPVHDSEASQ